MLHNNFYRSSGSAIIIRRIYEICAGSGIDFYFAGTQYQSSITHDEEQDLSWMPAGRYAEFDLMPRSLRLVWELRRFARWLREQQIEIVHAHHRRLAMLANLISPLTNIPVLYTGHNTFAWSPAFWLLAPRNATGVSPSVVRYLKSATRAKDPENICNPYAFPVAPSEEDKRATPDRVISVGRLEPIKGHVHLIQAWKILRDGGLRVPLHIIGEGYLHAELNAKIKGLGLTDLVQLTGYKSGLENDIRHAFFNVLASSTEGFPNVVVESAALRKASLVTDVDGSRDCVPPNRTLPNLVPYGSPVALAEAVGTWLRNPRQMAAEGDVFYDFLRGKCDVQHIRHAYMGLYAGILKQRAQQNFALRFLGQ
jgi:glycosyltransferase involved in cell wall biosynthesis